MSIEDLGKLPVGGYVDGPDYLLMRLRMLLTGTASPSDENWGEALKRLLVHVAANPVPGAPEDRAKAFAEVWGVTMAAPSAPVDERGEREKDAADEIRMLDLDDDFIPLVQGSDTPLTAMMAGRAMDCASPVPGSFVLLSARMVHDYDFAIDAAIRFEDDTNPDTLVLTLFGSREGSNYHWKWADLSRRAKDPQENAVETDRISGILHVIYGARIREIADDGASAIIEGDAKRGEGMALSQIVESEDVVLTGDDENVVFVMPVRLLIDTRSGRREARVVYQGRVNGRCIDGGLEIASVSTRI